MLAIEVSSAFSVISRGWAIDGSTLPKPPWCSVHAQWNWLDMIHEFRSGERLLSTPLLEKAVNLERCRSANSRPGSWSCSGAVYFRIYSAPNTSSWLFPLLRDRRVDLQN